MRYRRSEAKAYAREHMKGIWAAITYPFTADDEIDEAGLRRNLKIMADDLKIDGVFCTGLLGEVWSLTKEERKRGLEVVVDACRGKMQVIAHTGHSSAKEAVELTLHAQQVGADYAIMINPYTGARTDDMVMSFFKYVTERVDIGVALFNSSIAGYALSPQLVGRLADLENLIAIKNAQPMSHTMEVRRIAGSRIVVMDPNEEDWLESCGEFGQQALNSEPTMYLYQTPTSRPIREYTDLLLKGDKDGAGRIFRSLWPIREVYKRWISGPWERQGMINIQYVKAWMDLIGMVGGPVRPPLLQPTAEERARLKAELTAAGYPLPVGA